MRYGIVHLKGKLRRVTKVKGTAELMAKPSGNGFQSPLHLPGIILAQDTDIHLAVAQIIRRVGMRHGDHGSLLHAGILDLTDFFRKDTANVVVYAVNVIIRHQICSITKHSITSSSLMSLNFSTCMPHS